MKEERAIQQSLSQRIAGQPQQFARATFGKKHRHKARYPERITKRKSSQVADCRSATT
ncbi:MAG: hypothetical protein CM15mV149_220 [uncultured marine virus]|nr:MAG: hypothetical protein CM15mV149_220 [uncultured marine virus]